MKGRENGGKGDECMEMVAKRKTVVRNKRKREVVGTMAKAMEVRKKRSGEGGTAKSCEKSE